MLFHAPSDTSPVDGRPDQPELFSSLLATPRRARRRAQMLVSLLAHAVAAAALVLVPLALSGPPPEPRAEGWRAFFYDPPPAPPPPPARGPGLRSEPAPAGPATPPPQREPALVAPAAPTSVAPPEDAAAGTLGGHPEGSERGDPEGVEGGVEGGIVGGIPGGVLGGVIGGTGTGPVPVPVLRPDTPPRILRTTKPKYPQDAFAKRIQGTVLLEILIDARGQVARARVLQSVPGLDEAALEAVRSWLFVPAFHGGVPVATPARAPITFSIH